MLTSGAVLFAKDIEKVALFYQEILSMSVLERGRGHVVLEAAHYQLTIHAIPAGIAKKIQISQPPQRRTESAVKLFFPVHSLAQTREHALRLGGELNSPEDEWEARGFRACDGHDPEGNVVQFRQPISACW